MVADIFTRDGVELDNLKDYFELLHSMNLICQFKSYCNITLMIYI